MQSFTFVNIVTPEMCFFIFQKITFNIEAGGTFKTMTNLHGGGLVSVNVEVCFNLLQPGFASSPALLPPPPLLPAFISPLFLSLHSVESINHSVVPEAFQLMTERRAKERQEYEMAVSETQALRARMQEERQQEQEREEEEEVARMRHEQVNTLT